MGYWRERAVSVVKDYRKAEQKKQKEEEQKKQEEEEQNKPEKVGNYGKGINAVHSTYGYKLSI